MRAKLLSLAAAAAFLVLVTAPSAAPKVRCYGAAARDPAHPCVNHALDDVVQPSPDDAVLTPDAPCTSDEAVTAKLGACAFGRASDEPATASVALIGDSHATHLRAAMTVAANSAGWRGISLTLPSCPFTYAEVQTSSVFQSQCHDNNRAVVAWLASHPDFHTIVVSAHASARVARAPGQQAFAAKVAGYQQAWAALPPSVTRIVVVRDNPVRPLHAPDCIAIALAHHRPVGRFCAAARRAVLQPDPEAAAALRLHSPRVSVVDLTPFMCSPVRCFPVVGGVLVNKDAGHLSRAFSTTLGPYLLRRLLPIVRDAISAPA